MHPILQAFRRGLPRLPRRRSYCLSDGIERSELRFGAAEVVVARALCRFIRFDLGRVAQDKRMGALRLQLLQWSPFNACGASVAWTPQGVALVWCWDKDRMDAALVEQGFKPGQAALIPESALRSRPQGDGFRLLVCLQGFEAQHWSAGELQTSRWWPALPTERELLAFQRDCNLLDACEVLNAQPENVPLATAAWASLSSPFGPDGSIGPMEWLVYTALALALGVPAVALSVDHWRLARAAGQAADELAQQTEHNQEVLGAKGRALDALQQVRAIEGLQRFPAPLVLMVALARALPDDGSVFLKEFEMGDGKLRLLLASNSAEIAGADIVNALEQSRVFAEVKVVTQADPKQMGFAMTVRTREMLDQDPPRSVEGT